MNRSEFEALRELPGKRIRGDIRFVRTKTTAPAVVADGIVVENAADTELRMNLSCNLESGAKTINVYVPGVGPICRLDVDGPAHRQVGRSHKHSLQTDRCPDRNLPEEVKARPELSGKTLRDVFEAFCVIAKIEHDGTIESPDEGKP
jgi:hypothetical protein